MISHPREEALALYSSGDLEAGELRAIAEHIRGCAECRECVARFQQIDGMLANGAGEPSAEDLLDVRQRVMRALEATPKRRIGFRWAAAVAALAALAVWLQHRERPATEIHSIPARIATVRAPEPAPKAVPMMQRRHRLPAPGLRSVALVTRPGEEPLIKIATSDPKVIILLQPDTPNDERTESNDE
jgi:anti-sigma factor ChrR (cupin superfamily)